MRILMLLSGRDWNEVPNKMLKMNFEKRVSFSYILFGMLPLPSKCNTETALFVIAFLVGY